MTEISPEDTERLKKMFLDSIPQDIFESKADLEFLKDCVIEHIEKVKALSRKLPIEQFHTCIELGSIVTELEIALYTITKEKEMK